MDLSGLNPPDHRLLRFAPRRIGRTKGGLNSNLHAGDDSQGPNVDPAAERQMNNYKGAALLKDAFPKANVLLGDGGHDADWIR